MSEISSFIEVTSLESLKEMNSLIDFTISLELNVHAFHTAVFIGARLFYKSFFKVCLEIHIKDDIVFRYNKYSRDLSQTPWFIDGKKFKQYSVEVCI